MTEVGGASAVDKNYAGNYDFLFYRDDTANVVGPGQAYLQEYSKDYVPHDRPIDTTVIANGIFHRLHSGIEIGVVNKYQLFNLLKLESNKI